MSLPRRIVPGTTYMLTRRCLERRFFLRPSEKVNQICKFCLGVAAERTGMELHNFGFLSNHYHVTATDIYGNLPDFMQWLNKYIAKCVNVELGRWACVWGPEPYSAVELLESADQADKMVYVFNNPVSSGLVSTMKEWPGAFSTPADMERPSEIVVRPKGFFREDGPVPSSTTLRLTMPRNLNMSVSELERLVAEREQELRDAAMAKHRSFLGTARVLRQSPLGGPRTTEDRRGINPRVAAVDKWRRIEALQRLKAFLSAYREAWLSFAAGDRDVRFPFGTYGMRLRFGVMCNGP